MLKNYLKIAFRNLFKHKLYAFINVTGLAIGLACCILILLFVANEFSYDRFHEKADRIYRVYVTEDLPQRDPFSYSESPAPLAQAMEESFPGVERAVRVQTRTDNIRVGEKNFTERYHLLDPDFFEMFTFPFLLGNPSTALHNLNSVILSEGAATKLFGNRDVLGRILAVKLANEFHDFVVTGVMKDVPQNSSVRPEIIIPWENVRKFFSERALTAWFNVFLQTYVELSSPLAAPEIEQKLKTVVAKHYPQDSVDMVTLHLQPITDIYLNPDVPGSIEPTSDPVYSYILIGIAILILGIACINFMTLAIGRSTSRAREVGVRKVLGAVRGQLLKQFWGEALLMSFFALILGLLLAELLRPLFNQLAGRELLLTFDVSNLFAFIALMLLVGLIAGSYPALVLSQFQPAVVVKGESQVGGARFFGRSLVVLQFALSIFLIISTLVMADQLNYLRTKDLGFSEEQVVIIRNNSPVAQSKSVVDRYRNALANRSEVLSVSGASARFATGWTRMGFRTADGDFKQFFQLTADYDYLPSLEIELLSGRNFSPEFGTDSSEAIIVNEALVKFFDWESGIGKSLPGSKFPPHRVVGVVRDFNFQSLQNEVAPLAIVLDATTLFRGINDINTGFSPRALNFVHVRIKPGNITKTVDLLKDTWHDVAPNQTFTFSFLDEDVDRQYQQEERWSKIVGYASSFAILIACLGLFGLATLTVARRTKEIGVRKVLGASVTNIVFALSSDFGRLVLVANLVAWPFAYFAMQKWLQDFAYRIGIGVESFLLSAILAAMVALAAIGYQSVKAARSNPVDSLRYE